MSFVAAAAFSLSEEQLAIVLLPGLFGHHIGVAYHAPNKKGVKYLHLASHTNLRTDDFPPQGNSIASLLELPPLASKQMVSIIRLVSARAPKIKYGFDLLNALGSFENGIYKPRKGDIGLTCATFVSILFHDHKLPLVDLESWEEREENLCWADQVISWLQNSKVSEEHIEVLRENKTGLRVRPEEVAAAADMPFKDRPASFKAAWEGAVKVVAAFNEAAEKMQLATTSTNAVH